jgi:protein-L-isoaspartate(D-aspartate) O-methyltransferase
MVPLMSCAESHDGGAAGDVWQQQRQQMVTSQLRARDIHDARVLSAMARVPRHLFVPPAARAEAYEDHPLPIGDNQTISQPYIVALMTQLLEPKETDTVLEVGTGSGYQAAVLATLVRQVYSIELSPMLAASARDRLAELGYGSVQVRSGDGFLGWPDAAPFDGIIVTAAAPRVPDALAQQLREGGRIVIPLVRDDGQELMRGMKKDGAITYEHIADVLFVPMRGLILRPTS